MQYSSEGINEQKNKIEENLKYICDNIAKMKEPIFIELLGMAKNWFFCTWRFNTTKRRRTIKTITKKWIYEKI